MDVDQFIQYLLRSEEYPSRIHHLETFQSQSADFPDSAAEPGDALGAVLKRAGIARLYDHQAKALDLARQGKSQVIVTGTASGKSLCYHMPILDGLLTNPQSRALYLFPTKALAQDQLRSLQALLAHLQPGSRAPLADTYDGDTPSHRRKRIRTTARMILSNPDMLHQSILPNHPRWAEFLENLRFVVLDEIHVYRGVFGSHVANVLRRLERICLHHGSHPLFICTSATIANPVELAQQLTGREFEIVDRDGSPHGRRYFLFWNPPPSRRNPALRRSALAEAQTLLELMMRNEIQSLVFLRTRAQAEMLYRTLRQKLERARDPSHERIRAYRGGYLPSERREIEKQLFEGRLLAVTTTNALELGIDVGHIQASLVVGYPGTISSIWQQAGRAGRGPESSLAIFIASNDPEDQYLVRNPTYLLGKTMEAAAIDPENPYILANHMGCAAFELPLKSEESNRFGSRSQELTAILEQEEYLKQIDGRWYWSSTEYPAARTNLRTLLGQSYPITLMGAQPETLGTLDEASVQLMGHPGAIYLQEGTTYRVENLDFDQRVVEVEKVDVDYYTRPIVESDLRIQSVQDSSRIGNGWVRTGEVETSWSVIAYRKIRFYSQDNLGVESLTLPKQQMQTVGLWLSFDDQPEDPPARGTLLRGLQALENVLSSALPMLTMCDRSDIGALIQFAEGETPALFLYDRYPGGMGFAERGYNQIDQLLRLGHRIVTGCPCRDGCPSCVGAAEMAFSGTADLEQSLPDKAAAERLLAASFSRH